MYDITVVGLFQNLFVWSVMGLAIVYIISKCKQKGDNEMMNVKAVELFDYQDYPDEYWDEPDEVYMNCIAGHRW